MPNNQPPTFEINSLGLQTLAESLLCAKEREKRLTQEVKAAKAALEAEVADIEKIKMDLKAQADLRRKTLNILTEVPMTGGRKVNVRVEYAPTYPQTPFVTIEDIIA